MPDSYDAVVVGAGPNGLAAAIMLARAGRSVLLAEARPTVGGGTRSAELTLPGFTHDICAAIMPMAVASPFFSRLPLADYGLEWICAPAEAAHPLDDGPALLVTRSVAETAERLGPDAAAYRRLMEPFVADADKIIREFVGPLRFPHHPLAMARFGLPALAPASTLARLAFRGEQARAVFAGMAAHSIMPLERLATGAFGLMLGLMAHARGWPMARGGSQHLADALRAHFVSLGGEVRTGWEVASLAELPPARAVLLDVTPRQLLRLAGDRLPAGYVRALKAYRHGPGVFKIDYALSGPIPWRDEECRLAPTVHLGGTLGEIAASERAAFFGQHAEKPFVLLAQHTLFDPSRAPEGSHTAWAYCHVPNGSTVDMTSRIEAQIERFAPGFHEIVLTRRVRGPAELQTYNPNFIGGDINGGVQDLGQLFTRPAVRLVPYSTPARGVYLCSSSTPPGGGVHGMCGYFAARAVLRDVFHQPE